MALIKCPECENNISSMADTCPHCGFPIKKHIGNQEFENECKRLLDKITPIEFKYPEPRIKVCIKCGKPFYFGRTAHDGEPWCDCNYNGQPYPGVEIDYSTGGRTVGAYGELLYIQNQCVIPRHIGDEDSQEYASRINELASNIDRANAKHPDRPIVEVPPNPKDYEDPIDWSTVPPPPNSRPQPQSNKPQCPICKSTNLKKIAVTKKAAKVSLFGIFGAGDLGKTWQCENCGSKF